MALPAPPISSSGSQARGGLRERRGGHAGQRGEGRAQLRPARGADPLDQPAGGRGAEARDHVEGGHREPHGGVPEGEVVADARGQARREEARHHAGHDQRRCPPRARAAGGSYAVTVAEAAPRSASSARVPPAWCWASCSTMPGSSRWCSRPATATTWSSASAPACSSRARSTCSTRWASASGSTREGLVHARHRAALRRRAATASPLDELTGGRGITIYGQQEVVKDLIAARLDAGGAAALRGRGRARSRARLRAPAIRFRHDGERATSCACDVIAGCDGFHGVCRDAVPDGALTVHERDVPVRLARHPRRGRAVARRAHLLPPRPRLRAATACARRTLTRLYLQCAPDEDIAEWPDERIWEELHLRFGVATAGRSHEGPILEKGITPMRSFVAEPMQHGRLFLAGDAVHIVPPTGAKGLNLAVADVRVLARGARRLVRSGRRRRCCDALLRPLPAAGLARAALLLVDDVDAAPDARRPRRLRGAAAARAARATCAPRGPRRRRSRRTTSAPPATSPECPARQIV